MEFYQRLAQAIDYAKQEQIIDSVADLARRVGAPNPSSIDSIMKNHRSASKYTPALARELMVRLEWLAEGREPMKEDRGKLLVYDDINDIEHLDIVQIPFVKDFAMAAGDGVINSEFLLTVSMPFYANTLTKAGVKDPSKCIVGQARGISNEDKIPDGATIGIDTGCRQITSKKTYLITVDGEVRLKQLIDTGDGGVILRSFNPDKDMFPDVIFSYKEMVEKNVVIRGRMFWCSWIDGM